MTLLSGYAAWQNKFLVDKKIDDLELPYDEQLY